ARKSKANASGRSNFDLDQGSLGKTSGLTWLELDWQRNLKNRPVFAASRRRRELAFMTVDDHFGYGQTKALALRFRRDECIEDCIDHSRIDSLSGILYR